MNETFDSYRSGYVHEMLAYSQSHDLVNHSFILSKQYPIVHLDQFSAKKDCIISYTKYNSTAFYKMIHMNERKIHLRLNKRITLRYYSSTFAHTTEDICST